MNIVMKYKHSGTGGWIERTYAMDLFYILVGIATIISGITSIISLYKVTNVQKYLRKTNQNIKDTTVNSGNVIIRIDGNGRKD